jgi:hypothetical protein
MFIKLDSKGCCRLWCLFEMLTGKNKFYYSFHSSILIYENWFDLILKSNVYSQFGSFLHGLIFLIVFFLRSQYQLYRCLPSTNCYTSMDIEPLTTVLYSSSHLPCIIRNGFPMNTQLQYQIQFPKIIGFFLDSSFLFFSSSSFFPITIYHIDSLNGWFEIRNCFFPYFQFILEGDSPPLINIIVHIHCLIQHQFSSCWE